MTPCEKLGYKVGDEFKVVGDHGFFPINSTVTLYRDDGNNYPQFKQGNYKLYASLFVVKPLKPTKETAMTKSNKYQFHSLSESDIDWNRIAQDLNKKNPLAFVDAGNGEQYVVVYDMLTHKAFECDIEMTPEVHDAGYTFTVYKLEDTTFSDWVNWAREVKKAMWPVGRKAVVTVSLPKV